MITHELNVNLSLSSDWGRRECSSQHLVLPSSVVLVHDVLLLLFLLLFLLLLLLDRSGGLSGGL